MVVVKVVVEWWLLWLLWLLLFKAVFPGACMSTADECDVSPKTQVSYVKILVFSCGLGRRAGDIWFEVTLLQRVARLCV